MSPRAKSKPTDDSDPAKRKAKDALVNKLRRWETTNPTYQEMMMSANQRVAEENARRAAANHG